MIEGFSDVSTVEAVGAGTGLTYQLRKATDEDIDGKKWILDYSQWHNVINPREVEEGGK